MDAVIGIKATAPVWTPLFARAASVVTDGGTLTAHVSLVAREYGIPAVVGTGDATVDSTPGNSSPYTAPPEPSSPWSAVNLQET